MAVGTRESNRLCLMSDRFRAGQIEVLEGALTFRSTLVRGTFELALQQWPNKTLGTIVSFVAWRSIDLRVKIVSVDVENRLDWAWQ